MLAADLVRDVRRIEGRRTRPRSLTLDDAAADQLGHACVSMTQDRYFGRRTTSAGAAGVLQQIVLPTTGKD